MTAFGVPYARRMTAEPDRVAPAAARQRDLVVLIAALAVAVLLARVAGALVAGGLIVPPVLQVLVRDVAVWLPLVSGIACVLNRPGGVLRVRLRPTLGDLVFAVGIAIVARVVDAAAGLALTGSSGLTPVPSLGPPDTELLLISAAGVVLVSPVIEELVFRGLFQRLLADELTARTRWLAVVFTAAVFAVAHLFLGAATTTLGGLQVVVTTFVLGVLTGALVAMTDRIGGAVVAHVLFNAVAIVVTWPR